MRRLDGMALPTFLLIGAPRAGTSALHHWLGGHPDVCVSRPAQVEYFSLHADRGLGFYEKFFAHYRGEAAVGESTSMYLTLPHVPRRIAEVIPSVKLLAVLRDPVHQALSSWWMLRTLGVEHRSFAAAVADEMALPPLGDDEAEEYWGALSSAAQQGRRRDDARYLLLGHYQGAIERYLTFFDRRQLTLLLHDDLLTQPERTVADVAYAIGVDPVRAASLVTREVNVTATAAEGAGTKGLAALDPGMRRELVAYFASVNAGLADLVGRDLPWEAPRIEFRERR